ncbi:MAG: hypothetical protein QW776_03090 [Candidatus Nitrosocaldus sp.]
MIEDIRYWEASSWKDFVQGTLVPLLDLAKFLAENLALDSLGEKAKSIGDPAGRAVDVAETIFGESIGRKEIPLEGDVPEIAKEFLDVGANMTAGHSKHMFFAWRARKITKSYLEEHYPELKEPEKFSEMARILGWPDYWKPPSIKSKIVGGYLVYSYSDYLTLFEIYKEEMGNFYFQVSSPHEAELLGGLICS